MRACAPRCAESGTQKTRQTIVSCAVAQLRCLLVHLCVCYFCFACIDSHEQQRLVSARRAAAAAAHSASRSARRRRADCLSEPAGTTQRIYTSHVGRIGAHLSVGRPRSARACGADDRRRVRWALSMKSCAWSASLLLCLFYLFWFVFRFSVVSISRWKIGVV